MPQVLLGHSLYRQKSFGCALGTVRYLPKLQLEPVALLTAGLTVLILPEVARPVAFVVPQLALALVVQPVVYPLAF